MYLEVILHRRNVLQCINIVFIYRGVISPKLLHVLLHVILHITYSSIDNVFRYLKYWRYGSFGNLDMRAPEFIAYSQHKYIYLYTNAY